jgi:hypothetical protein
VTLDAGSVDEPAVIATRPPTSPAPPAAGVLPADHSRLIDDWASCPDWPRAESLLRENEAILLSDEFGATTARGAQLRPEQPRLQALGALLDEIARTGFEATLVRLRDQHRRIAIIRGLIETRTRSDSRQMFDEHREMLTSDETMTLLSEWATVDPIAVQHVALLRLCQARGADDAYDLVQKNTPRARPSP